MQRSNRNQSFFCEAIQNPRNRSLSIKVILSGDIDWVIEADYLTAGHDICRGIIVFGNASKDPDALTLLLEPSGGISKVIFNFPGNDVIHNDRPDRALFAQPGESIANAVFLEPATDEIDVTHIRMIGNPSKKDLLLVVFRPLNVRVHTQRDINT